MFQSTTRTKLRGHRSQSGSAKFSAMISSAMVKGSGSKLREDGLLRERKVQRIINLRPRHPLGTGVADRNAFVHQFLHRSVEEFIYAAGIDEFSHFRSEA